MKRLASVAGAFTTLSIYLIFTAPGALGAVASPGSDGVLLRFPTHIPKQFAPRFDSAWSLRSRGPFRAAATTPDLAGGPLYSFQSGTDGTFPQAGLVAVGGVLYGTDNIGGMYGDGSVFALSASGSERVIHSFSGADGAFPMATLIARGSELYGTTYGGGANGYGAVFEMNTSGVGRVLYSFKGGTDGASPHGRLIVVNGTLYGTTRYGGRGYGTVYTISASGVERVIYTFKGGNDGAYPAAGLVDLNGMLYGTTEEGGSSGGTVYRVSTAGAESVIHAFTGADGDDPASGLIAIDGMLYGTTQQDGAYGNGCCYGNGTVFKMTTTGAVHVLHTFSAANDGKNPYGDLVAVNDTIYGTTPYGGTHGNFLGSYGTAFSVTTAGVERVLHNFSDQPDGASPLSSLVLFNGELYGTTNQGGAGSAGSVFELTPSGSERVFYSFKDGADGTFPEADLTGSGKTLYGTTSAGGAYGDGTVFTIDTLGAEKVLYAFRGGSDGAFPLAGVLDVSGTLYGTTSLGGKSGLGTIFKVSPSGTETVLHSFTGGADGACPAADLIDVNGTLYGTTSFGGFPYPSDPADSNKGTVFEVSTAGVEHVLHAFGGGDGSYPRGALLDAGSTFYGTTVGGGNSAAGTLYSIDRLGSEKTLYSFYHTEYDAVNPATTLISANGKVWGTTPGGGANSDGTVFGAALYPGFANEGVVHSFGAGSDGQHPYGALSFVNGEFYGTTNEGGAYGAGAGGYGTVFETSPSGTERVLYSFTGGADGANPDAGLFLLGGTLYTTLSNGGTSNAGTVFALPVP
jgi:uncharacterized repeat protein (TIGR03803 family)